MKLAVIIHPNSKKPRIEKDLLGTTHIYVKEPPLEGRANQAVIKILAEQFKTSKSKINITSGSKSRNKVCEIIN